MLHCSGQYGTAAHEGPTSRGTVVSPVNATTESAANNNINTTTGTHISRQALSEQLLQIKTSLVSLIQDDLLDKVPDSTVQKFLKLSDQIETLSTSRQNHNSISIAIPALAVPSRPNIDSPNTQPVSAHARIKSMDLNDIPTYRVESYANTNQTSGDVSPVTAPLPKRKSVVFFQPEYGLEGSIHLGPSSPLYGDEGHKFVARSYSGFGSFRRASRHASMAGGELAQLDTKALSFRGDGMPVLVLGDDNNGIRSRFSRPIARHRDAFVSDPLPFIDEASLLGPLLDIDVDSGLADLLSIEAEEADVLKSVAVRIFSQYSLMRLEAVDVSVFLQFVDAISRYTNATNPFRNTIHTAETLISVHRYLKQPYVANNYTDSEITSLLLAALCVNLGYLGVSNEFLLQLHHPLSRIFSIVNTSESVSTMIGLQLLEQYNFLSPTCSTKDMYWLGLQEGVADLLSSSGPREHQRQLRQVMEVAERGFVSDEEVPLLMSCVLRAAMMGFCCKPKNQHVRFAELWVNEAYKQSECERIMGFSELPKWCDDTAWASVQAFVMHVAAPYFEALGDFFPEDWSERLSAVAALYVTIEGPLSNNTATFRDGDSIVNITVDPNAPEWSDQSSLTLSILTSIIPQHLFIGASTGIGRVGTAARSRMDHYLAFLQLYYACEKDPLRFADFGGRIVQLAIRMDPLYIGEYASALIDEDDFNTFKDAAALILETESAPDTPTALSPTRRTTSQTSDAFIVLLLRMMNDHITGVRNTSQLPPILDSAGQRSVNGMERSSLISQGPFRGKWRLTTSNSIYDSSKK